MVDDELNVVLKMTTVTSKQASHAVNMDIPA